MNAKTEKLAAFLTEGEAALVTAPHERRYLTGFASSDGYVLVTREESWFLTDSRYIEAAQRQIRDMPCLCYQNAGEALKELLARCGVVRLHVGSRTVTVEAVRGLPAAVRLLRGDGGCPRRLDGRSAPGKNPG